MQEATEEELVKAAKVANAYEFIIRNQTKEDKRNVNATGFERRVGNKGSLLSGGQKQRIAIARAIIRNPTVLLLDEATSALEAKSEDEVQIGLYNSTIGRTALIIAHRLSTIQKCDMIYMLSEGAIIERGKYDDLLKQRKNFFRLANGMGLI
jgi:ABC-type multidrug transport system fused ATPase/permease subunit